MKDIAGRRSVREYKPDAVSEDRIADIVKAAQCAPSARNNRAVEYIIVTDGKTKNAIFDVVGQEFVKSAPVLIIPATDTTKTTCPVEDLSVASENMLIQATALGLGTVWKALKNECSEQDKVKDLLGIPAHYMIINIIPVGYPASPKPEPHNDTEFDRKKIHIGRW